MGKEQKTKVRQTRDHTIEKEGEHVEAKWKVTCRKKGNKDRDKRARRKVVERNAQK